MKPLRKAVFIDKDGTLIENVPFNVDTGKIRFMPGAFEALRLLHEAGYLLCVVSNQAGIAQGCFEEGDLGPVEAFLRSQLALHGVPLTGFYFCPHQENAEVAAYALACDCRKPRPGMLFHAAAEHSVDLDRSWLIGDILDDIEAGHNAGCASILVDNGSETEWDLSPGRYPDFTVRGLVEAAHVIVKEMRPKEPRWKP